MNAKQQAEQIYAIATPILRIFGVGGRRWKRNVATGARIGPWLQGQYKIIDERAWHDKGACLYLVGGGDSMIRYVGISRNGLKHRWRTSPAYDAETTQRLLENQLFHSQCWKHIEQESLTNPGTTFEVRTISARELLPLFAKANSPLMAFAALEGDDEGIVAGVERWLCNHSTFDLARWNVAMTKRA